VKKWLMDLLNQIRKLREYAINGGYPECDGPINKEYISKLKDECSEQEAVLNNLFYSKDILDELH